MNKVVVLLLLSTFMAGCHSTGVDQEQQDTFASLRCWQFRDQSSITREQVNYIRNRSDNGDLQCKTLLGDLYERGHGVAQDVPKAKALYQSVAEVNASAYYQLGRMEEEGIGGPPDYVKARAFYQRATAKPGNSESTTRLARLMEEGKGGPEDLQGALQLYLSALASSVGDAWKGIDRLRGKGLVLSAEQEQRYNKVWVDTTTYRLRSKMRSLQMSVSSKLEPGSVGKPLKLQLECIPGSNVPSISLLEGSGDSAIDQAVLQAMSTYRFSGEPIFPKGQASWKVIASFYPGSK
ncbi:tetratricopeptide repeat protein [Pseudomonas sp. Fl4BN1]|uniref:tetratricopeptide repeat protein n=1 Tax=Pseudomonas sp. Fl4BN1 TaxID=2697651 RepID=UPI0013778DA8|nr:tetratricopeptide repeat protein [Pseudomonas sp. Fl4BN1]NBF07861.1 sel1 repeat family protein [Pseudomonas sp. Fl4BN1]